VRQFYGIRKNHQIEIKLNDTRLQLRVDRPTKDLDVKKQLKAISPNFIHSLDAAALTLCIDLCRQSGITGFRAVHDNFGTHAADMYLLESHLRTAFVEVHQAGMLQHFRDVCRDVHADWLQTTNPSWDYDQCLDVADCAMPPMPTLGTLDLHGVLRSEYFFA